MSRASDGTYTAPASSVNPAVEGTEIDEVDFNALVDDLESALTDSIARSGKGSVTAHVDFTENASPGTPAANDIRLYASDVSSSTALLAKDSAGNVYNLTMQAPALSFSFDTSTTTSSDPGDGDVRFNHGTFASITGIAMDDLDSLGTDVSAEIQAWDDLGSSTNRGYLVFQKRTSSGTVRNTFLLTGSITDSAGWSQLVVTPVATTGNFAAGDPLTVQFMPPGPTGIASGDVTAASSFGTDNVLIRSDGTGKGVQSTGISVADTTNNVSGTGAIVPASNDGGALGSATLSYSDLFLASGAVVNFNNGNVTITHAANTLTFSGATVGFLFANTTAPSTNDGAALGTSSVSWSDLFLASGAVINFNAGDVTITHAADTLTFAGAASGFRFGNVAAPSANDGSALGTTALQWSDLFLAEGGVINFDNGDVTVTQSGNSLTVAGGNLIAEGTATNDSAASGVIGEYLTTSVTSGSAVSLTSTVTSNVGSISLTAGDWDVTCNVATTVNGSTTMTYYEVGFGTTSATLPTRGLLQSSVWNGSTSAGANQSLMAGPARISVASTTTVYFMAASIFAVSTAAVYGSIHARRAR